MWGSGEDKVYKELSTRYSTSPQYTPVIIQPTGSAGALLLTCTWGGHELEYTTRTEMHLEEIQANVTQQLSEKFAYAYSFHLNRETQAINVWRGT